MNGTAWSKGFTVEVGGADVVNHVGTAMLRMLGDKVGLTDGLSAAMVGTRQLPLHDRGRVLVDLAATVADGGTRINDIAVLGDQPALFQAVASVPTAWRALEEADALRLAAVAAARASVRVHVWRQIVARHGRIPPCRVAGTDLGDWIVIRLDATIIIAHSDKEQAAKTFKKTYGHHPLTAWCDNTGELLAVLLRPGNAGSNTAADHITVLKAAIAQIPKAHRGKILVTVDGAGSTHALVDLITQLNAEHPDTEIRYAVGFDLDHRGRVAVGRMPEPVWCPALDAEGEPRTGAHVAELTGLYRTDPTSDQLSTWPNDLRVIARREQPHPGAQLTLFEQHAGYRYQLTATNLTGGTVQLPRSHPPRSSPRGVPHPLRQGHRPAPAALQILRHQRRLVPGRRHGLRPTDLAGPTRPGRRPRQSRTQNHPLPTPAHRRQDHPRPTQTTVTHTQTWPWARQLQTAFTRIAALPAPS